MTVQNVTKPDFVLQTFIDTTPERLWQALTDEKESRAYHFAAAGVQTDLRVGGRFDHILPDGGLMLGGEILAIDPPNRIEMTFEPGFFGPDAKASRCAYEIERAGDLCKLTILHFDIPEGQEGVAEGWSRVASGLKTYLETGKALAFAPYGAS